MLSICSHTFQDAVGATGNGTILSVKKATSCTVQVVISNTATVTFEATLDGSNWVAIMVTNLNTGVDATTATASGVFRATIAGFTGFRVRVSSWTSGTVTATGNAVDL
jgi:hypothetical protein